MSWVQSRISKDFLGQELYLAQWTLMLFLHAVRITGITDVVLKLPCWCSLPEEVESLFKRGGGVIEYVLQNILPLHVYEIWTVFLIFFLF